MPGFRFPGGCIDYVGDYKAGDPPPSGFMDWFDWAAVQHKAGLKQVECRQCSRWNYPQEMSDDAGICLRCKQTQLAP